MLKSIKTTFSKHFKKYGSYVSWKMDETYLKHKGKYGGTLDFMVSDKKDEKATCW